MADPETIYADAGRVTIHWTEAGLEITQTGIDGAVTVVLDPDAAVDFADALMGIVDP